VPFTLAELAKRLGAELRGAGERRIDAVRPLEEAAAGDLALLARRQLVAAARCSAAGALLTSATLADEVADRDLLVVADPRRALAEVLDLLHPPPPVRPGVHPTAVVEQGCEVDPGAEIGPYAVLGAGSRVAAGVRVGAHAVIGRHCRLGAGSVLHPHVVLYDHTEVGERTVVHAGVVLGADGFGYLPGEGGHRKVPQVGGTVLEADVEVGANSAVDRATLGVTRVGRGSKIDNLVQVGHNVQIGRDCLLCGQAGVAGSARLGRGVVLGGQAGVSDHCDLGDGVQVAGGSAVFGSVPSGGVAGIPAIEMQTWRRQAALLKRLGAFARRLRKLEKRMEEEDPS
jgi:UDP-3-O-[3-hydroxymyristoyl] glucosamine N-acyltransferase